MAHSCAGWKAGTKLKFEEDRIAFEIAQSEHAVFTRSGNDLHCVVLPAGVLSVVRGDEVRVKTLDNRHVRATFAPFALRATVFGEGFPYKREADATGRRTPDKGVLVVHLFFNWAELLDQSKAWGRIALYVAGLWLFLTNPTLVLMLFFGMNAVRQRAGQ